MNRTPDFTKIITSLMIVMVVFLVFPAVTGSEENKIRISIPEEITVDRDEIRLGDIAQIEGGSSALKEKLGQVVIEKAARPGYQRQVSRQLIRLVLQDKGFDEDDLILNIPQVVRVITSSQEINQEQLLKFARRIIRESLAYEPDQIIIEPRQVPEEIIIPNSEYSLSSKLEQSRLLDRISFPVDILIAGQRYRRIYLNLKVKVRQQVFIARKNLQPGEHLSPQDFKKEERVFSQVQGRVFTDWNDPLLQDGVLSQALAQGEILTSSYLKKPIMVNWGDEIQAEVKFGGITITTMVRARERGRKGDFILVENIESGQKFKARVINSNLVRVIRQ